MDLGTFMPFGCPLGALWVPLRGVEEMQKDCMEQSLLCTSGQSPFISVVI